MTRFRPGVREEYEGPAREFSGASPQEVGHRLGRIETFDKSSSLTRVRSFATPLMNGSHPIIPVPGLATAAMRDVRPRRSRFPARHRQVWAETGPRIENIGRHGVYFQLRKQVFDQIPLARAQTPVPATPVNGTSLTGFLSALSSCLDQETAAFRSSTRSVFSHENRHRLRDRDRNDHRLRTAHKSGG